MPGPVPPDPFALVPRSLFWTCDWENDTQVRCLARLRTSIGLLAPARAAPVLCMRRWRSRDSKPHAAFSMLHALPEPRQLNAHLDGCISARFRMSCTQPGSPSPIRTPQPLMFSPSLALVAVMRTSATAARLSTDVTACTERFMLGPVAVAQFVSRAATVVQLHLDLT